MLNQASISKSQNISPNDKVVLLQYNQMKGVKKGKKLKWLLQTGKYSAENVTQSWKQISKDYLVGLIDQKTKQIKWVQSVIMQVKAKLPEEKQSNTTSQTWDIGYKKKLVEEFGTSKSKRKINQMLSNTIN